MLEDGTLWAVSGPTTSAGMVIADIYKGTLTTSGTAVSGTLRDWLTSTGQSAAGTLTGSFVAGTSLDMTATASTGGGSSRVQLKSPATSTYNYGVAATLADLAGNWPGFFTGGDTGTIAVSTDGKYSTTTSAGCKFSGTMKPRASGKNVYDVTVAFGAAPCSLANGTATGNAIIGNLAGGKRQLAVMASTADNAAAAAFFGIR